ncbi:autophagy-related protein 16-1-like [Pollicipes pollicipes]|uniref:autophagy-related protein 16-1-like n=1 Tax=Pollicipes pollicipes TaxID=41117 RepID=UPI0018855683|nr:autophagy-related protein 16-1-like [Pollicipes pollicipes]
MPIRRHHRDKTCTDGSRGLLSGPQLGQPGPARFTDGSNKVVSGSRDRTLREWDLVKGGYCEYAAGWDGPSGSPRGVRTIFSSSICFDILEGASSSLLSGHYDSTVKVWDKRDKEPKHVIAVEGVVTSLALGTDYKVLCCTRDDVLKLVDLRALAVVKRFQADGFHVGCDYSRAVFSPDCKYVAAGSSTGDLFIWNVATQKLEKQLSSVSGSPSCVIATAWHPDGSYLVSSDKTKLIAVWSDM